MRRGGVMSIDVGLDTRVSTDRIGFSSVGWPRGNSAARSGLLHTALTDRDVDATEGAVDPRKDPAVLDAIACAGETTECLLLTHMCQREACQRTKDPTFPQTHSASASSQSPVCFY